MSCETGGCGSCETPCDGKLVAMMEALKAGFRARVLLQEVLQEELDLSIDEEPIELTCKAIDSGFRCGSQEEFEPILIVNTLFADGDAGRFVDKHRDILKQFGIKTVRVQNIDEVEV